MKSQADQNKQASPQRAADQPDRGQGGGQPKPGNDRESETPDIPQEIPKREIDRKPSDPQSVPDKEPDKAPEPEMPEPGRPQQQLQDPDGSEENNDVQEQSPDLMVEDDRDTESLVDKRDRFPFPNK